MQRYKEFLKLPSHPVWVCGLKPLNIWRLLLFVGHTLYGCVDWNLVGWLVVVAAPVTPCMGVWIETSGMKNGVRFIPSHPVWVCGLKRLTLSQNRRTQKSHPVWVCGLKPYPLFVVRPDERSHPVWVCGLKHNNGEMYTVYRRHTLYGCVDWNPLLCLWCDPVIGHTLYGCVDWNCVKPAISFAARSHTLYGCVDWNTITAKCTPFTVSHPVWVCGLKLVQKYEKVEKWVVTPCMGVWIETLRRSIRLTLSQVTPCMGVWIET